MKSFIFFLSVLPFINAIKYLNCGESHKKYLEHERKQFGIDQTEFAFIGKNDKNIPNELIYSIPTSCMTENNTITDLPNSASFIYNFLDNVIPPVESQEFSLKSYIYKSLDFTTNIIWKTIGFIQENHYNEKYWYYKNNKTDKICLFFHGLNGMNGVENLYLIRQLMKQSSVYVSMYPNSFIQNNNYNHTYTEHINNVIYFIKDIQDKQVAIVANSYGSIRVTTICKRYNCSNISKIVMTDAINTNIPFSIFPKLMYGIFQKGNLTSNLESSITIKTLKREKHYNHFLQNLDWYEWSIDSQFMEYYKQNLVLVIGDYDMLITVNKTSYAMTQLCEVIYTKTEHGMVLFSNILNQIKLFG
jgi:hypothetical protein